MALNSDELKDLKKAVYLLENPGLAAKLSNLIGKPIEAGIEALPEKAQKVISSATQVAIRKSLGAAIFTMDSSSSSESYPRLHKAAATVSGAAGGLFGLAGLTIELPISTTIMLRSIADIARYEGEDVEDIEAQLSCIVVFALGGTSTDDDSTETGYFATRSLMAKAVSEAAAHIAEHGLKQKGAPALVRFILMVAERYGIPVTAKTAAQSVPVLGAFAGGTLNFLFIDHFQDMAKGHFTVRRLERSYGKEEVRDLYEEIKSHMP